MYAIQYFIKNGQLFHSKQETGGMSTLLSTLTISYKSENPLIGYETVSLVQRNGFLSITTKRFRFLSVFGFRSPALTCNHSVKIKIDGGVEGWALQP